MPLLADGFSEIGTVEVAKELFPGSRLVRWRSEVEPALGIVFSKRSAASCESVEEPAFRRRFRHDQP